MPVSPLPRLDVDSRLRDELLPLCRLGPGEVWVDPLRGHRVGVIDATQSRKVEGLCEDRPATLVVNDPPYNIRVGSKASRFLFSGDIDGYLGFSRGWVDSSLGVMAPDSFLYVWLGADQRRGFQPLPEFMLLMRSYEGLRSRSYITVRNQRGYGTQKNWMSLRQELLCYATGSPEFSVIYTDIPKVLRGYYKTVGGRRTENLERGKSDTIRPGNVWLDVQQVFYRMEENVPGAYAQKPLAAVSRIISSSSKQGDDVADLFAHSGTTLIACEQLGRRCSTGDIDPIFCELTIRRLERFRETGKTGWQWQHPFPEIAATP